MKSRCVRQVNVNYSLNDIRKTLAVPLVRHDFRFGTAMTDPVWGEAARADDFEPFCGFGGDGNRPLKASQFAVFRTPEALAAGWFFESSREDRLHPANPSADGSAWEGDVAELHFGSMGPEPWNFQLCVGITGRVFCSGDETRCRTHAYENDRGWGGEVLIPLDLLPATEGGVGFNLCRCDLKNGDHSCWCKLHVRFHEVENFGELLLTDYETAVALRRGSPADAPVDRAGFEQLRRSWETAATEVVHGPYLSNPTPDSVCVNWCTAGAVAACLEYAPRNAPEETKRIFCSPVNGILASETAHFARITGLAPATEYEYRLYSLLPVINRPVPAGAAHRFRTLPGASADFSFYCVSDLHSTVKFLKQAMTCDEARRACFHVILGDTLHHATGRNSFYRGFTDPMSELAQADRPEIPMVFVRGNHEQIGAFATEYFTLMKHESGREWYTFTAGDAFFLVLDSGGEWRDSPDNPVFRNDAMLEEERRFIEETTRSRAWREAAFRVVFVHIPPLGENELHFKSVQPLAEAQVPPELLVAGHTHSYARIDGGGSSFAPATDAKMLKKHVDPLPYARIVLSIDTGLNCEFRQDVLRASVLRFAPDGRKSLHDELILQRKRNG